MVEEEMVIAQVLLIHRLEDACRVVMMQISFRK